MPGRASPPSSSPPASSSWPSAIACAARPLQVGGASACLGRPLLDGRPDDPARAAVPPRVQRPPQSCGDRPEPAGSPLEAIKRHQPAWQILLDQLQRAALAFNVYPDRTMWYWLTPASVGLRARGAVPAGAGVRHPAPGGCAPLSAGGLVVGGDVPGRAPLTQSSPSSERLVTLAVPAAFFVALALYRGALAALLGRVSSGRDERRRASAEGPLSSCSAWRACAGTSWSTPRPCSTGTPTRWSPSRPGPLRPLLPDIELAHQSVRRAPPLRRLRQHPLPGAGRRGDGRHRAQRGPPAPTMVRPDKHAAFVFLPERQREASPGAPDLPRG